MINDPYQHQFVQEPTNHSWLHATPAKDTLSNLLWYLHTSSGYWSVRPKEISVHVFAPKWDFLLFRFELKFSEVLKKCFSD